MTVTLAHAAADFVGQQQWVQFGFARLDDHARERFQRSGRWVRDLAALGEAFDQHPTLEAAVEGRHLDRPLGQVAALLIARNAAADSIPAWVDLAGKVPIRQFKRLIRDAKQAASREAKLVAGRKAKLVATAPADSTDAPPDTSTGDAPATVLLTRTTDAQAAELPATRAPTDDADSDRALVRFLVPAPMRGAFNESRDLFRAVEGGNTSATSFVDALTAEAQTGPGLPDIECIRIPPSRDGETEMTLARQTGNWSHLAASAPFSPPETELLASSTRHEAPVFSHAHAEFPDLHAASTTLHPAPPALHAEPPGLDPVSPALHAGGGADEFHEGTKDPDSLIRHLLALQDEMERQLGRLLARMSSDGAWKRLKFADLGHYAEQRLGLARSSAQARVRLARSLGRLKAVRDAYEEGRVGFESALCIVRAIGNKITDRKTQMAWVARAEQATVKRLKDEVRAIIRNGVKEDGLHPGFSSAMQGDGLDPAFPSAMHGNGLDPGVPSTVQGDGLDPGVPSTARGGGLDPGVHFAEHAGGGSSATDTALRPGSDVDDMASPPMTDEAWHGSLRRQVGMARKRVRDYGLFSTTGLYRELPLNLSLPEETASRLLGAVEAARSRLAAGAEDSAAMTTSTTEVDCPRTGNVAAGNLAAAGLAATRGTPAGITRTGTVPAALIAARMFSSRGQTVPAWVGLLGLLEDFVNTWDVSQTDRRPSLETIYARDGWRCMAPGCTSRRNLEDHHVIYRSRGGSDELQNRVCLCRFHHQWGEHGNLASCRGEAPLGLVWALGRDARGGRFCNELRL